MEIKTGISLQTKQQLSQLQVESLNILAMSMMELKDFLQNEEIENPLVEYTSGKEEAAPITYKETERFYNGTDRDERRENELYEIEDSEKSLEDLRIRSSSGSRSGRRNERSWTSVSSPWNRVDI